MIEELFYIEKSAYRDSFVHQLDARVKILGMFAIIIAIVAVPYSPLVFTIGLFFLAFIVALWAFSGLPWPVYAKRLCMVLPFGLFIIIFQIFFTNRYYSVFHVIADLPFGIHIYAESVEFALILLVKFIVCVSAIILLSSTTKLHDILEGAGRMGLPPEFSLTFGMMIRYLFVFGYIYRKINESLITRCFDPFDPSLTYRYRMKQIGYTVGTIFVRSYEQGERVYTSMLCRGYGKDSHIFVVKKPLRAAEWSFLLFCLFFVIAMPITVWLNAVRLF
ncbi:MAG: cobalt ECF transporter T component CbiQ [Methanoregula sp.]